jgi:hypothetical protein
MASHAPERRVGANPANVAYVSVDALSDAVLGSLTRPEQGLSFGLNSVIRAILKNEPVDAHLARRSGQSERSELPRIEVASLGGRCARRGRVSTFPISSK